MGKLTPLEEPKITSLDLKKVKLTQKENQAIIQFTEALELPLSILISNLSRLDGDKPLKKLETNPIQSMMIDGEVMRMTISVSSVDSETRFSTIDLALLVYTLLKESQPKHDLVVAVEDALR